MYTYNTFVTSKKWTTSLLKGQKKQSQCVFYTYLEVSLFAFVSLLVATPEKDINLLFLLMSHFDSISLISVALPVPNAFFGRGTGPILLDNVGCSGTEQSLVNCTFSRFTQFDNHFEDAGVRCFERNG